MSTPGIWPVSSTGRAAAPFVVIGLGLVIVGGFVSAAAAPTASYHSSWAVAYVVLVAGVAQGFIGLGQAVLTEGATSAKVRLAELCCWNAGNALVVAGTLLDVPIVLYLGCLPLIATLMLVLRALAHAPSNWLLWAMRVVVVILLVSMPTGIVLQAVSH
ncbi:hypothetical protein [Flexivirga alba]|uniref:Uncharacterized protein n=1 Tax=Flexivirga alba TaxID=702742 RepID=A0ABW2AGP7_9MICO